MEADRGPGFNRLAILTDQTNVRRPLRLRHRMHQRCEACDCLPRSLSADASRTRVKVEGIQAMGSQAWSERDRLLSRRPVDIRRPCGSPACYDLAITFWNSDCEGRK